MMGFKYNNCHSFSASAEQNHLVLECGIGSRCADVDSPPSNGSISSVDSAATPVEEDGAVLPRDYFDGVVNYLNQMLMEEEDLEQRPCMFQDISALQAAEKSFHDALTGVELNTVAQKEVKWRDYLQNGSREKRTSDCQDSENGEGRSNKQFASYDEESTPESEAIQKMYDKALLCPGMNPGFYDDPSVSYCNTTTESETWNYQKIGLKQESKRGRPRASQKKPNIMEVVDLNILLTQCAQAVVNHDNRTAYELLNTIRRHSSPCGEATERLAHYFANALEARVSGMGTTLYTAFTKRKGSAADTLKAYQTYILACPFQKMSNIFAGKSIGRLTKEATNIHVIDFGILYGFQWPCFIRGLSLRPGGPPKLRITGIELPQPGFRPAQRVEETGRRLSYYCKKFNVPFEYHAIAKKWETIRLEDLKIDRSEAIVVNCLYRLRNIPDEAAEASTARNDVLNLIKKINPDVFVHGVLNGTYNVPFFATRFREALHHFSSMFDMLEKTIPCHDQDRLVFEKEVLGRDSLNVIACEGTERIERPETYKQWQVRNQRAGFRQLPPNQDIVKEVRAKVRLQYHKDFLVYEDCNWVLQCWKGRVIFALSCWKPVI